MFVMFEEVFVDVGVGFGFVCLVVVVGCDVYEVE